MYVTVAHPVHHGEAFTIDYDLPNPNACRNLRAISLAMFAGR